MSGPVRIQRQRTKGWKAPDGAVYVGRPGPWGNPYSPGDYLDKGPYAGTFVRNTMHAVVLYREWALRAMRGDANPQEDGSPAPTKAEVAAAMESLRGKTLMCWCKVGEPCHADVLLELANGPTRSGSAER
ncbi:MULTISPECIES: DUF4326 domain-containing protein [unclassified Bradyrhizobium]